MTQQVPSQSEMTHYWSKFYATQPTRLVRALSLWAGSVLIDARPTPEWPSTPRNAGCLASWRQPHQTCRPERDQPRVLTGER